MFVPIVNVFAFGYLYRFLRDPHYATDGGVSLPEWDDWMGLLWDGLRLVAFAVAYAFVFSLLAIAAEWCVAIATLGLLRLPTGALLPLMAVLLLPVFLVCLCHYQRRQCLRDLLSTGPMLHRLRFVWWPMVWPALGFVGLWTVCGRGLLYGIALFIGFGTVFASYNELLRHFGDRLEPCPPPPNPLPSTPAAGRFP